MDPTDVITSKMRCKHPKNVKPIQPDDIRQGYCGRFIRLNFMGIGLLEVTWLDPEVQHARLLDRQGHELRVWRDNFPHVWYHILLPFKYLIDSGCSWS